MSRRFLLAVFLILSAASGAAAQQGSVRGIKDGSVPDLPAALQAQKDSGAQAFYMGKFDVLDGWMLIRTGQPEFYYATPGGKALVLGILFDSQGKMLTGEQLKELQTKQSQDMRALVAPQTQQNRDISDPNDALANLPPIRSGGSISDPAVPFPTQDDPAAQTQAPQDTAPAPAQGAQAQTPPANAANDIEPADESSLSGRLFNEITRTANMLWGQLDAPAFWAFIDPNCPHCQQFLKEVEPFVNNGEVAVHIIPMGYDAKSKQQGAVALAASDGAQRMVAYAKGQTSLLPPNKDMNVEAITANQELMRRWRLSGTPIIVYQTRKSKEIRIIRGRPADINEAIADIKG